MASDDGKTIDLTEDGGVVKEILKEGDAEAGSPTTGSNVSVHYTGTLLDGSKFDSSRDRDEPFTFSLNKGQVIKGWDKCVASMHKGERCKVTLAPNYAYGEQAQAKIPANSTLVFDIELLDWTEPEMETVWGEGSVKKRVLGGAHGWQKPAALETCGIRYTARFSDSGELLGLFGQDAKENNEFEFVVDDEQVPEAFDRMVQSMKKGERSKVFFNDAKVLPEEIGRPITVEVELVKHDKLPASWEVDDEAKLESSIKWKNEGNELFKQKLYKRAITRYEKGCDVIGHSKLEKLEEAKANCYNNAAACHMALKDYARCLETSKKVLEMQPKNNKALYRQALAYLEMDEWVQSERLLNQILEAVPNDPAATRALARLKAKQARQDAIDRERYSKLFA